MCVYKLLMVLIISNFAEAIGQRLTWKVGIEIVANCCKDLFIYDK